MTIDLTLRDAAAYFAQHDIGKMRGDWVMRTPRRRLALIAVTLGAAATLAMGAMSGGVTRADGPFIPYFTFPQSNQPLIPPACPSPTNCATPGGPAVTVTAMAGGATFSFTVSTFRIAAAAPVTIGAISYITTATSQTFTVPVTGPGGANAILCGTVGSNRVCTPGLILPGTGATTLRLVIATPSK